MTELAIHTDKLTKRFGGKRAVSKLSIEVARGQIYGFLGPNGAGKTTTMKMLATLLKPFSGKATVLANDIGNVSAIRSRIGYMPEMTALYERLNIEEYLNLFAYAYRIPFGKRAAAVDGVIELLDLDGLRFRMISDLSKGVRQRIALARCLIHDPELLLLDEPASGLDPSGRVEMRELLKELRSMGKTVFVSSHILSELEEICDAVGILENGRLVFSGTMAELHEKAGIQRHFRLRAEPAAALEGVSSVAGVQEVSKSEDGVVFSVATGVSQSAVVEAVMKRGGSILELSEQKRDLEDMFMALTQGAVT